MDGGIVKAIAVVNLPSDIRMWCMNWTPNVGFRYEYTGTGNSMNLKRSCNRMKMTLVKKVSSDIHLISV